MLKKGSDPRIGYRCKLLALFLKKGLSCPTQDKLVESMIGQPERIKEQIAEKLLKIIESSKSEEEMLKRAKEEIK